MQPSRISIPMHKVSYFLLASLMYLTITVKYSSTTDLFLFMQLFGCILIRSFFYEILLNISFQSASIIAIIELMPQKISLELAAIVACINILFQIRTI